MERIDELVIQLNKKCAERKLPPNDNNLHILEDGQKVTVPYKTIKEATFSEVKRDELIDLQHSARLQYRLMLLDAVIKASVNFVKGRISVIYNPLETDNTKEKISIDEIIEFLAVQGVNVEKKKMAERDYDYYKEFYTYAYMPPSIRSRAPYGHTPESWAKEKPIYEQKMEKYRVEKTTKFKDWQRAYAEDNPELADKLGVKLEPAKAEPSGIHIFKKKKKKENQKGFWFHGI